MEMLVAVWLVHLPHGFFMDWLGNKQTPERPCRRAWCRFPSRFAGLNHYGVADVT
jgi:hypothetical protein